MEPNCPLTLSCDPDGGAAASQHWRCRAEMCERAAFFGDSRGAVQQLCCPPPERQGDATSKNVSSEKGGVQGAEGGGLIAKDV